MQQCQYESLENRNALQETQNMEAYGCIKIYFQYVETARI